MKLIEILQHRSELGGIPINNGFAYFRKKGKKENETIICKARLNDFVIIEKYSYEGDIGYRWIGNCLLIFDYEKNKVHFFLLPEFKEVSEVLCDDIYTYDVYDSNCYIFLHNKEFIFKYNKTTCCLTQMTNSIGKFDVCYDKNNLFFCKNYHNLYIFEMKCDAMGVILQIAIDDVFPEEEVQKIYSDYTSREMRLYKIMPYEDDMIIVTSVGIVRMTMCGKIVWKTIYMAYRSMQIIGHYGYESYNSIFYRIDLDNGELCLYDYNGELPPLSINGHEVRPSGDKLTIHNGLLWRMLYDGGLTLLAAIDPETGQFKYFHRFYDIAYENCRPKFINGKLYLYDAITDVLHVLEEVEGEPEKTFCGVPMSETELELVDTTKKVNNKKPAPTYEDSDIPLFEEIKQVAHIEHACVLDAECINSLEDYSSLIVDILSLADVRKFTIVEHTLSGSISLKKGRKEVEFTPDGSDYIDTDALLKALNKFLPICGAKGRIFSLWMPDMLQAEMFFYTEDTEAVENYSAQNLQIDEAVDFEDMKGEIKW